MDLGSVLGKICDVEEPEPGHWQIVLAKDVWLNFVIGDADCAYSVFPSWLHTTDSVFTDLERLDTDDLVQALDRFRAYFGFRDGKIDPVYLPVFFVWKKREFSIPSDPRLIFFTTAEYLLRAPGSRFLEVSRTFSRPSRTGATLVRYDGPEAQELVEIVNGKICRCAHRPARYLGAVPDDPAAAWKWLSDALDPSQETADISLIKGYEKKLRELPWQDDLEAVYAL